MKDKFKFWHLHMVLRIQMRSIKQLIEKNSAENLKKRFWLQIKETFRKRTKGRKLKFMAQAFNYMHSMKKCFNFLKYVYENAKQVQIVINLIHFIIERGNVAEC